MGFYFNTNSLTPSKGGSGGGGSSVSIDNLTITENASQEIQAVGVINQNSLSGANPLQLWEGSEQEWNEGLATTWYYYYTGGFPEFLNLGTYEPIYPTRIFYLNGNYFALRQANGEYKDYSEKILISADGENWSAINQSGIGSVTQNIIFAASQYSIVSSGGIFYSSDASTWTKIDLSTLGIPTVETPWGGTELKCYPTGAVAYGNNVFVATMNNDGVLTSSNGTSWTFSDNRMSGSYKFGYNLLFLNNQFIADLRDLNGDAINGIATSSDGTSWTVNLSGKMPLLYQGGKYFRVDNSVYGGVGYIQYSTDLENWTSLSVQASDIIYANGEFRAINGTNYYTSADGLTWGTAQSIGTFSANFLCAGDSGAYFYTDTNISSPYYMWSGADAIGYYYLTDETPTTSSVVYSSPDNQAYLSVTAVGTGTITLSDGKTYTYNSSNNEVTYQSVGSLYPYLLCNIEGVGVKIGDTIIADATGTVNNATLTITQGGVSKGTFTANASSDVTIALDAGGGASYTAGAGIDITNNVISVDAVTTSEVSIDSVPTQNSTNLITSGGVYAVVGNIEALLAQV